MTEHDLLSSTFSQALAVIAEVEPRVALLIFAVVLGAVLVAGLASMLRPVSAARPATS